MNTAGKKPESSTQTKMKERPSSICDYRVAQKIKLLLNYQ